MASRPLALGDRVRWTGYAYKYPASGPHHAEVYVPCAFHRRVSGVVLRLFEETVDVQHGSGEVYDVPRRCIRRLKPRERSVSVTRKMLAAIWYDSIPLSTMAKALGLE